MHRVTEQAFGFFACLETASPEMKTSSQSSAARGDALCYLLAAVSGAAIGWADVFVNDLLFTALLVLAACMTLGLLRPRWPWRWVITVAAFVPLTEFTVSMIATIKPTRAQIWGSFLTALPGTAGAYGGAVMRKAIDNLRQGK
jgi:ABC-type multidrug transport system permease subunit